MNKVPAKPHQSALRRGRSCMPGAAYFLTVCVQRPCQELANPTCFQAMLEQCMVLKERGFWHLLALMVMPDHVHLLVRVGTIESLGDVVRAFKGPLTPVLRAHRVRWQAGGFFDRRMRDEEELSRTLRYMLTNPYRRGLVAWEAHWPFWSCEPATWAWFGPTTNHGRPFREWVREQSPGRDTEP